MQICISNDYVVPGLLDLGIHRSLWVSRAPSEAKYIQGRSRRPLLGDSDVPFAFPTDFPQAPSHAALLNCKPWIKGI